MKKEKILVTGGCGYIGSVLVPMLLEAGYSVRVFDNVRYDSGHSLMAYLINSDFEFVRGDIRNEEDIAKAIEGVDTIIHLAAIAGLHICEKDPKLAHDVNVGGTENILRNRGNKPIILASTVSNYGEVKELNESGKVDEDTPLNAKSVYGLTKIESERLVIEAKNSIVFRFATAFGLSSRLRIDSLINDFVYKAVKDKQLIVFQKDFRRPFIHVRDLARGLIFALKNKEKMLNEVYNLGSEEGNFTKEDIVMMLKKKLPGFNPLFTETKGSDDQRDFFIDYKKLYATGFRTTISMDEGLDELIKGMSLMDIKHPYANIS